MVKSFGFTLVELLITVAIAGILLTVGVPKLSSFLQDSELINTSNRISTLTTFARSESMKRGQQVVVCRSSNSETCSSSGYFLIVGLDANDDSNINTGETLLKITELVDSNNVSVFFKSLTNSRIVFSSKGTPDEIGTIEICDSRGKNYAKAITLNIGGQLRHYSESERSTISCA
ncbi:GspH/FimT family pseudopilin [Psychrobium sp. 1_MG-2023]|uniref:GspH/FimT family pseudopilin n=1 Tax=Psychrobium sp. 1_MG-2023 TaxID=3062624 RepID=UPI000C31E1D7|nr:GspH/FimT family pseudopilin [Psychrobium sp. 1_MG-2023]MDP2561854.1 GspH/FimT family pseudopilin [Psychrobium sp. 1_MG-2023]PKF55879.1 hypothetical protein CW748_11575 [Alteromonadales bacterium alter-6D02]